MFCAILRPGLEMHLLEERHAPTIFAVVNQERHHLREWLPWVDATLTEDDSLTFIRASLEQFASNNGFAAGIFNGERLIGVIGTHKVDWMNRSVELGYWIAREFQGQGIITDACRAVITHLFQNLDLHRVQIRCAIGNTRSCAIPRRLGFVHEGTMREGQLVSGKYFDLHIFGMLKEEWRA